MNAPDPIITRPAFAPGIFPDMPAHVYHRIEAMSASGAKKILQSPQHFRLMRDTPSEPTAAMQFGTAVHDGVLEPDTFSHRVACAPDVDKRTKLGKAEWADFVFCNDGKLILAPDDFDNVRRCVDAIHAHPGAMQLLDGAQTEVSLFWNDARYDVPCKCRWDIANYGGIADVKTTTDASPGEFARSIAKFLYHAQASMYVSGGEHVLHESPRFFALIAVEKEPPHAVACYYLPGDAIIAGAYLISRALERYRDALTTGRWIGYPDTIEQIKLPRYALRFDD